MQHPWGKEYPDPLIQSVSKPGPNEQQLTKRRCHSLPRYDDAGTKCSACGWSEAQQSRCSYSSHVKPFHGASDRGAWASGSSLVLKERADIDSRNEVRNLEFIQKHTTIPIPEIVREWIEDSGRYYALAERVHGETLEEAWTSCLAQLRAHTSPVMSSVDGGPIYSGWLFQDDSETPHGPMRSDAEMGEALLPDLKGIPSAASKQFIRRLPKCESYTLTHCDLNMANIIVRNGEPAGILDWEYVATKIGFGEEDAEWKRLLRARLDPGPGRVFNQAVEFWMDLYSLSNYPETNERGKALFAQLIEESST
ncbi:hypothetical protein BDW74DRAFT_189470 [Aspergillus multicolor]|uniref:aminoglycoside phosphotransferase family protein n=1 Tax=Aspergillus multicolor TaxID=41759 RepID=UPI003CCCBDF2